MVFRIPFQLLQFYDSMFLSGLPTFSLTHSSLPLTRWGDSLWTRSCSAPVNFFPRLSFKAAAASLLFKTKQNYKMAQRAWPGEQMAVSLKHQYGVMRNWAADQTLVLVIISRRKETDLLLHTRNSKGNSQTKRTTRVQATCMFACFYRLIAFACHYHCDWRLLCGMM